MEVRGVRQIVGDGPQQVAPHLFGLAFHPQLFLLFDAGGQGSYGHNGHTSIAMPENRFSGRKLKAK